MNAVKRPSGDVVAGSQFLTSTLQQDVKQVVHLLTVDAVLLLSRGAEEQRSRGQSCVQTVVTLSLPHSVSSYTQSCVLLGKSGECYCCFCVFKGPTLNKTLFMFYEKMHLLSKLPKRDKVLPQLRFSESLC